MDPDTHPTRSSQSSSLPLPKSLYYNGICVDMILETPMTSNIISTDNMYAGSILQETCMLIMCVCVCVHTYVVQITRVNNENIFITCNLITGVKYGDINITGNGNI